MLILTSSHPSAVTIHSSARLRIQQLAPRLHRLGPRHLYQFLAEIVGGATDPMARLEVYCEVGPDVSDPVIRLVK
jgi:hypothetical protein